MGSAWLSLRGTLAAPWQLAGMCSQAATWHTIGAGAEMIVAQCHGGLTVVTPAAGQDTAAPVVMRSLIQLDGDVLLMIDRSWLAQQKTQAPEALEQALARHQAQISAALAPLRQGFETATQMMILAGRSRWSIVGAAGLSQGGAFALAPDLSISSMFAWASDPTSHVWMLLWQSLSVTLVALVALVRLGLRWWIRRRIGARLPDLMQSDEIVLGSSS